MRRADEGSDLVFSPLLLSKPQDDVDRQACPSLFNYYFYKLIFLLYSYLIGVILS